MCELVKPLGIKAEPADPVKKEKNRRKKKRKRSLHVVSARACPETRRSSLTQLEMTNRLHRHKQKPDRAKQATAMAVSHHQGLCRTKDHQHLQE